MSAESIDWLGGMTPRPPVGRIEDGTHWSQAVVARYFEEGPIRYEYLRWRPEGQAVPTCGSYIVLSEGLTKLVVIRCSRKGIHLGDQQIIDRACLLSRAPFTLDWS